MLGVCIDHQLNWKEHVSIIKSKMSKCVAIMYRARHVLDKTFTVHIILHTIVKYKVIRLICNGTFLPF